MLLKAAVSKLTSSSPVQGVDELTVEGASLRILKKTSILVERSLLVAGAILLTLWLAASLHGVVSSRFAIWQLETARAAVVEKAQAKAPETSGDVDFSLWAVKRVQAYKASLLSAASPPLGVLEIAKTRIRVPVFDGTDELTLNRGV